jgi:hypothetical protein
MGAYPTTANAVVGTGLSACICLCRLKRRHKQDTASIPCAEDLTPRLKARIAPSPDQVRLLIPMGARQPGKWKVENGKMARPSGGIRYGLIMSNHD